MRKETLEKIGHYGRRLGLAEIIVGLMLYSDIFAIGVFTFLLSALVIPVTAEVFGSRNGKN